MARSIQTPLGALARGMEAGMVGTAAMDLLQFARYQRGGDDRLLAWEFSAGLKDWEQAPAPALIGKGVVEGVFQRQLPPERAPLVNNLMHWGYGMAWGGLFGLVAGSLCPQGPPRLGAGRDNVDVQLRGVAAAGRVVPADLGVRRQVLARDLGDHLVYGVTAAGAERLLAGRCGG